MAMSVLGLNFEAPAASFTSKFLKNIYNPFASYAHPPIVRDHANMHEIGSHIPVVADRYPWISPSCGVDIAATGRKN